MIHAGRGEDHPDAGTSPPTPAAEADPRATRSRQEDQAGEGRCWMARRYANSKSLPRGSTPEWVREQSRSIEQPAHRLNTRQADRRRSLSPRRTQIRCGAAARYLGRFPEDAHRGQLPARQHRQTPERLSGVPDSAEAESRAKSHPFSTCTGGPTSRSARSTT